MPAHDNRTPVYLVHGYNSPGADKDLAAYAAALDQTKYRVVPFNYDYTQRLGKSAAQLTEAVRKEGRPVHILAHSMGGLVSMGAAKALDAEGAVKSLTTIATPFNGHKGAAAGKYLAPFNRREVWSDMVPGSDYQRSLSGGLRSGKHHALIVDRDGDGEADDDGTISVASQTKRKILGSAASVSQFRDTHTGILRNPDAIKKWLVDLDADEAPVTTAANPSPVL